MLDTFIEDIRYGLRAMRRAPGVMAGAILTRGTRDWRNHDDLHGHQRSSTEVSRLWIARIGWFANGGATLARFDLLRNARSFSGTGAFLVVTETAALGGTVGPDALRAARVTTNFL